MLSPIVEIMVCSRITLCVRMSIEDILIILACFRVSVHRSRSHSAFSWMTNEEALGTAATAIKEEDERPKAEEAPGPAATAIEGEEWGTQRQKKPQAPPPHPPRQRKGGPRHPGPRQPLAPGQEAHARRAFS